MCSVLFWYTMTWIIGNLHRLIDKLHAVTSTRSARGAFDAHLGHVTCIYALIGANHRAAWLTEAGLELWQRTISSPLIPTSQQIIPRVLWNFLSLKLQLADHGRILCERQRCGAHRIHHPSPELQRLSPTPQVPPPSNHLLHIHYTSAFISECPFESLVIVYAELNNNQLTLWSCSRHCAAVVLIIMPVEGIKTERILHGGWRCSEARWSSEQEMLFIQ